MTPQMIEFVCKTGRVFISPADICGVMELNDVCIDVIMSGTGDTTMFEFESTEQRDIAVQTIIEEL